MCADAPVVPVHEHACGSRCSDVHGVVRDPLPPCDRQRIKAEGFQGVETPISVIADKEAFAAALHKHGLQYIAMVNTMTFEPKPSNKLVRTCVRRVCGAGA